MRTAITMLFGLSLLLAEAQVIWDHAITDEVAWRERQGHHPGVLKSGDPAYGFDLHYHRLVWDLDPAVNAIAGNVTSYFTATAPLTTLRFDADTALAILSVTHHGNAIAFTHTQDAEVLIDLPAQLNIGEADSITIHYSGEPAGTGFGSFAIGTPLGNTALWTLSEPYGARDWWPCKQDLNDKIDSVDAYITVPGANEAVSNGVLMGTSSIDGGLHTTFHWRHRYPIAFYLIATAVCDYSVSTLDIIVPDDTIPMWTYAYPQDDFIAQLVATDVQEQMPLYHELFGPYPFAMEQYGHAQFGWGGGMEHQTMTFMGGWSYELAAHELAHQWFGDKVTCATWQDLWLNEGFATYLSGLCYEFLAPTYWPGWTRAQVDDIVSLPDGSLHVSDTADLARLFSSRLTYRKGAMVLHMLRWVCGDSAFFAGCRNYLNDPELSYGSAYTADLQAHLEASSGKDLDGFMDDWYTGEGFPTYTVEWTQDANGLVMLHLDQVTSHASVAFFELPVPILFKNGSQDQLVVLDHTSSGQLFQFQLPFQADSALFDPDTWLISGGNLVLRVPVLAFGQDRPVLYPNPTDGDAILYLGNGVQGPLHVRITDQSGRLVLEQDVITSERRVPLRTATLNSGAYVVEVSGSGTELRTVLIKH